MAWNATIELFIEWPNPEAGKPRWSFGDRTLSAYGATQKLAKERLGDLLVTVCQDSARAKLYIKDWPDKGRVASANLAAIKLTRTADGG